MDDTTILGGALNQLGQTVKQAGKQIVKMPEEMTGDLSEQLGMKKTSDSIDNPAQAKQGQWQSDEERKKFLQDLYGSTDQEKQNPSEEKSKTKQTSANPLVKSEENTQPSEFQQQITKETPEEQKKLIELRNQLHKEVYYDPLVNPVKKQEERPAEKVENEKKQEMMDLQKKEEKKPQPIAVVREQNKAEMFRGAAG
jgi:HD superfamily phosphohydrolase